MHTLGVWNRTFCLVNLYNSVQIRIIQNILTSIFSLFCSLEQDVAFVIDGWALEIVLSHYRKAFTELAVLSRTAICCRVTPSQKAQVFF